MATLETALRTKILALDAVSALTTTVRWDKLDEDDDLKTVSAVVISVEQEEPYNDLAGVGGLVKATVRISSLSESKARARSIAEAIRINGSNPGTGLAGFSGVSNGVEMDCILQRNELGFFPYIDDSDDGFYFVDSIYQVDYGETI